ncbi:VanZ family protein [Kurthia sibirica]|uniref:VanZ family protein n=2 Tax=Kurthia sibirica TaxID=202750 RepID=UPI0014729A89|nr:VanZ family protein [Kurthia sibirica]
MNKTIKISLQLLFFIYLILLSKLILLKYYSFNGTIDQLLFRGESLFFLKEYNLIPFHTITAYIQAEGTTPFSAFKNLAGNIIGFIPFGIFMALLFFKKPTIIKIIVSTFSLSFIYELIQLIFRLGTFDVDDLLLNTLGGLIGFLIYKLLYSIIKSNWIGYTKLDR